jgi:hypothetical protein
MIFALGAVYAWAADSSQDDGVVAYIVHVFPDGARLDDVARIRRDNDKPTGDSADLRSGDQIFLKRPEAILAVRLLLDNTVITVQRPPQASGTSKPDWTVPNSAVPGLTQELAAWFNGALGVWHGADLSGSGNTLSASRGSCYNESQNSNEPVPFEIPVLIAERSMLAPGKRALYVSWRGGAQPFSVRLSWAGTDAVVVEQKDLHFVCATRLPVADLSSGHYRLTVTDANNTVEREDNLFVGEAPPPMPNELVHAKLPAEARELYFATWLSVQDKGKWAFEAQQQVAAMNCTSKSVEDWLRQRGGLTDCGQGSH